MVELNEKKKSKFVSTHFPIKSVVVDPRRHLAGVSPLPDPPPAVPVEQAVAAAVAVLGEEVVEVASLLLLAQILARLVSNLYM